MIEITEKNRKIIEKNCKIMEKNRKIMIISAIKHMSISQEIKLFFEFASTNHSQKDSFPILPLSLIFV